MTFTDLGKTRGLQFRPLIKFVLFIFVANFLILMMLGAKHVESPFIEFGQISTIIYFANFLVIIPLIGIIENSLMYISNYLKDKLPIKSFIFSLVCYSNSNNSNVKNDNYSSRNLGE